MFIHHTFTELLFCACPEPSPGDAPPKLGPLRADNPLGKTDMKILLYKWIVLIIVIYTLTVIFLALWLVP